MIYDISPPITPTLCVWPGDSTPSREILLDIERGDHLTLSTLRSTVHVGAHADAPSHYGAGARTIDQQDLQVYLGRCRLLHVNVPRGGVIGIDAIEGPIDAPRILLATGTYPDPFNFNEDFASIDPALIAWLKGRGVKLIGLDTPSVDPFTSKTLAAHAACLEHDVAILEGLVLRDVPHGLYDLIALPLRLEGFDASPVRAVLRSIDDRID